MNQETWTEFATCRSIGPTVFYPEEKGEQWREAIKICMTSCPVRLLCLDYVMRTEFGKDSHHRHGVWAGLKPYHRVKYEAEWLAGQESAA